MAEPQCDCGWLSCPEYRDFFASLRNDVRAGPCLTLDFDTTSLHVTLRKGIVKYVEAPVTAIKSKTLHIARHHYDPRTLAFFEQNEKYETTGLSKEGHKRFSDVQDPSYSYIEEGSTKFFLLPCMSEHAIADYVDGKTEIPVNGCVNGDSRRSSRRSLVDHGAVRRRTHEDQDALNEIQVAMVECFHDEAQGALSQLQKTYGTAALERVDMVLLMDGWNKVLGWETMWKEACWFRWRILVAREELSVSHDDDSPGPSNSEVASNARCLVEENKDPLAKVFGTRVHDGKNLIFALFDEQIRSLCPHKQTVQRESYRKVVDERGAAFGLTLECNNSEEIFRLFSTLGIHPSHYLTLCEAFLFTMESHSPYSKQDDEEDLEKPLNQSAYARFVAQYVAKPGIKDTLSIRETFGTPLFSKYLPEFWTWVKSENDTFGEDFYSNLLESYPELLDYFARADMDTLASHIGLAVDLMVDYPTMVGESDSSFRVTCDHLGEMHKELGIPSDTYPMIGMNLLTSLKPFAARYAEESTRNGRPITQVELEEAFSAVYEPTMSFTFYPILREERTIQKATEFFESVAEEWDWSPSQLSKRLLEVKLEISATGTYHHTSEELQLGARLAWRNSTKVSSRTTM